MSQSLSKIWIHLVFSTKNRKPYLKNPEIRKQLHEHMVSICNKLNSPAFIVGGVEDHVHLLLTLNKRQSLSYLVEKIKTHSSKWIKTLSGLDGNLNQFYWQSGYGAFSVSQSSLMKVVSYIQNQEAHHQKISFEEELRKILDLYGVAFDERYLWE